MASTNHLAVLNNRLHDIQYQFGGNGETDTLQSA
jgi:hypothetical protein